MNKILKPFQESKRLRLLVLLFAMTLFDFVLLGYRLHAIEFDFSEIDSIEKLIYRRGVPTFLFLIWNLFLAWIPYLLSLILLTLKEGRFRRLKTALILGAWLLFFPNAPYILTDLLHFRALGDLPVWYDLMLLISFAYTGLMLGWISLMEVQSFLMKRHHEVIVRLLTFVALVLCSYGIYLGRFQRWNSWDIVANPVALFEDMFSVLMHPSAHASTLGLAVVLGCFLILGYLMLTTLTGNTLLSKK